MEAPYYTFTDGTRMHAHDFHRKAEHVTLYTAKDGVSPMATNRGGPDYGSCSVTRCIASSRMVQSTSV